MQYSITQLANAAGTTARALRFYEERGLLQPERGTNGYRLYTETDLLRAFRIVECRRQGLSITQIQKHMNTEQTNEQIAAEADAHNEQYREETYEKYDPQLVQQSQERFANWTTDKKAAVIKEGKMIVEQLAEQMKAGTSVEGAKVQKLIAAYHNHMNNFYDCSLEVFAGLGEMYVEDPKFKQYYEKVAEGLAEYVRDAIRIYAA